MNPEKIEQLLRLRLGVRVGHHTAQYVLNRLAAGNGPIAVMGGDARTGVAVRKIVDPQLLADADRNVTQL